MDLQLEGKIAVIAGPAKGIGRAITLALAREGVSLVLAGRDQVLIEDLANLAAQSGVRVHRVACDITDPAQTEALAAEAERTLGRVDILVNAAGGTGPLGKTGWETTAAELEQIMQLNVGGCFNTARAVLPGMIARRYGKIINIGGTFGMRGQAGRMAYSASKWALRGLTKSLALEAGPHNINVNCIAPGMVDGERVRTRISATTADQLGISVTEAMARHAAECALRRVSQAEDVAHACLFLASDVSRQITGIDLPVDGGWAAV